MRLRKWIWPAFVLMVAAQLAVPAAMILARERTLQAGAVFKFKTRPVDPADAFRGRYVWLSLEPGAVKLPDANQWQHGQKAFAVLATDPNGFACVSRLVRAVPVGETAVPVRITWADVQNGEVHIQWPDLDRYYMTEAKAPAAEAAYWKHSTSTNQSCHVTVRVRGAHAVIENLFIEDLPIHIWLQKHDKS